MLKKKPDEPLLASDIDRKRESFAMPPSAQAYGSPSLEEILGDEPVENRRATVFAREGTEREGNTSGGTEPLGRYRRAVALPAMDKRANPVEVAANSVTVPIPIYAVPPGYQSSGDGTNMYLRDSNGNLVKNPLLQKRIDNFRFNKCGIAADLGSIAGESAGGLGRIGAAAGGVVAAGSNTLKGLCS